MLADNFSLASEFPKGFGRKSGLIKACLKVGIAKTFDN